MHRVFIVDDHTAVRQSYALLIRREMDMGIGGEATTGEEALVQIRKTEPDIVVLDVSLPGPVDGVELLKQLQVEHPSLSVLVVSGHDEMIYAERILRMGARGYVMKGDALAFMQALRHVADGGTYVSAQVRNRQQPG